MHEVPEFDEAESQFRAFLHSQNQATEIRWLLRGDFLPLARRRPVIRWPLPMTNREVSVSLFNLGRALGRGVELAAILRSDGFSFAHVWIPASDRDAEYGLISGLKLSVASPLPDAMLSRSGLRWALLQRSSAYKRHLEETTRVALGVSPAA